MIGLVVLPDNREPFVCKYLIDFNEHLKFIEGSYGLIFEYNEELNTMCATKRCQYMKGSNLVKEEETEPITYNFISICKECQKSNNMTTNVMPCINCSEDNCKYCKQFNVECQCDV